MTKEDLAKQLLKIAEELTAVGGGGNRPDGSFDKRQDREERAQQKVERLLGAWEQQLHEALGHPPPSAVSDLLWSLEDKLVDAIAKQ